ncbi:guanine deaminase [Phenylobacterium sp.]|uniref:guanine deaminase n=1 Tax=Phenylobacterium sp. TaxID=1871053 RepID=UPI002F408F11
MSRQAYRAALLHTLDDPSRAPAEAACAYHPDGLLVVEDGHVAAFGAYADLAPTLPDDTPVEILAGRLITPGFVDAHVHYPQIDIIGSWSGQLLQWLDERAFPAELAFADRMHADQAAEAFLGELLRNGTTSALVFATVHKGSVEALFEAALARDMRLVAGKVLMDRNAPAGLLDTVESGRADSEALIRAWRGRGRLGYAVTPRFVVTSSEAQLATAGALAAAHPEVLVHSHLSENTAEIAEVARLFPERRDYLDVFAHYGLVGDRSVFAHGVHSPPDALARMATAGSTIAFCPASNLMLGSGLFDLQQACGCGVQVALATDVGGGPSFSILGAMGEAYKVGQLRGQALPPLHAFYLATLAGACALKIDDRVGNLAPGKEADFLVLDPAATPLLARRLAGVTDIAEIVFALSCLGDDRVVERTYLAGRLAHARRPAAPPASPEIPAHG